MPASVAPWIVAALAALAVVFLFLRLRAERASLHESEAEVVSLEEKLRAAQKRSGTRTTADRRREDEVGELRRKLEKAKKRANQAREEQLSESHRIKELEERLRLRDADMRAARSAATRTASVEPPRPPAAAPASSPVSGTPTPAPPPPAAAPEAPEPIESEALAVATKRAEQAEAERSVIQAKFHELETKLKRMHGKAKTQDKLYASIRLELEAKKDRLGTQQEELERLRAMRVSLMDLPSDDVPPLAAEEAARGSAPSTPSTTE